MPKNFPSSPFAGCFFQTIVELNRLTLAFDFGLHHQIFLICGTSEGLDFNDLVIDLTECARVSANEQKFEFFLQALLLLGRGFAPTGACGQGSHAAKIDVLHQFAVDQLHGFVDVAGFDAFVCAHRVQGFIGDAFDKGIGRFVGCHHSAGTQQQAQGHEK
jgi:hypothetical protein